jgi:hypothetical protein
MPREPALGAFPRGFQDFMNWLGPLMAPVVFVIGSIFIFAFYIFIYILPDLLTSLKS